MCYRKSGMTEDQSQYGVYTTENGLFIRKYGNFMQTNRLVYMENQNELLVEYIEVNSSFYPVSDYRCKRRYKLLPNSNTKDT